MKKNKMMRTASGLMVAALLTTSIISGTFAKYTTTNSGTDSARVAKWGFEDTSSITLDKLFEKTYTDTTNGKTVEATTDVIAPGTTGEAEFAFKYNEDNTKPEVAYTFSVDTTGSSCDQAIQNNPNILWRLDGSADETTSTWGTWSQLMANIKALSGDSTGTKRYEPGSLPTGFGTTDTHKIEWKWVFDNNGDVTDTSMGNEATSALDKVTIKIAITATQVD